MSRRTDRTDRTDRTYRDRPEESRRTERTERTERNETAPRTHGERSLQEAASRSDIPDPPSASTGPQPRRTPNHEDPYPVSQGDRAARANLTNEYFVPKEGIDREVITADVCRYLGNDALVRPGTYTHPQTRQSREGYFITAYRNLTTQMIADLKADSERWQAERRQILESSRGSGRNAQNASYSASRTHESRQYYGPTTPAVEYSPAPTASTDHHREEYDTGSHYGYPPGPTASTYGSTQPYPAERPADAIPRGYHTGSTPSYQGQPNTHDSYFSSQTTAASAQGGYPPQQTDPRGAYYSNTSPTTPAGAGYPAQQSDPRGAYYSGQPSVPAGQGYASQQQAADPYGRTGTYGDSAAPDAYAQYPDPNAYAQAPITSTTPVASSGSSRRDRGDRDDRDRHGHRRR